MKIHIFFFFALCFIQLVQGQNKELERFAYTNATIHLGNGQSIENGTIAIEGERIALIATQQEAVGLEAYTLIDAKGKHIYPGLIALNTQLGLVEVESVRATRDFAEVGILNPNVRSLIAYNTDSEILPTVRSNGVLISQVVPRGGRISGQSSAFYTQGHTWENAVLRSDLGIHLWWPSRFHATGWWGEPGPYKGNKNYERDLDAVLQYMQMAQAYTQKKNQQKKNIKFEAMRGLFDSSKTLFIHVEEAKAMLEALDLLADYNMRIVLVGASEAWLIADELKVRNAKLILGDTHSLPSHSDSDIEQPYKTPALLYAKGIDFALSMNGVWQQRNLPFQAGQAVSYGLPYEVAIEAITSRPARFLGIDANVGTLEKGKEASFILSKGDVLDMSSSVIEAAYIKGKAVDLDDKHKRLNREYSEKYGLD